MGNPGDQVVLSRNEVEALAAKAARGAGLPWGVAEEAGFAAGWLNASGIDGLTPLLAHLRDVAGSDWQQRLPRRMADGWTASAKGLPVCPVALGTALCDFAEIDHNADSLPHRLEAIGPVAYPVLVLPFLATIARSAKSEFEVTLDDLHICLDAKGVGVHRALDRSKLSSVSQAVLRIRKSQVASVIQQPATMAPTASSTLAGLDHLALQTTVPPSARSRADAGSGSSDND